MKRNLIFLVFAAMFLAPVAMFTSCGEKEPTQQPDDPDDPDNPGGNNNPKSGVVINGVGWATANVDMPGTFAARPEAAGMFYQWGSNTGWSATDPIKNSDGGTVWSENVISGNVWPSFYDPCPEGWHVPTRAEFEALCNPDKVISEWTTVNGVSGRRFIDVATEKNIFLPASGYRNISSGALGNVSRYGYYWSALPSNTLNGYALDFSSFSVDPDSPNIRSYGFSVRCVSEK